MHMSFSLKFSVAGSRDLFVKKMVVLGMLRCRAPPMLVLCLLLVAWSSHLHHTVDPWCDKKAKSYLFLDVSGFCAKHLSHLAHMGFIKEHLQTTLQGFDHEMRLIHCHRD